MNVRELRVFLKDLDGDMPVLVMEADNICPPGPVAAIDTDQTPAILRVR